MKLETLADLKPDQKNARKHNPRNVGMIERALGEVGAARSIVVDEDGVILAGNATVEAAANAGIERVQVVDADGETLIAVRRSGLTDDQKRKLALYDNRTAELADWDANILSEMKLDGFDFGGMFAEQELTDILAEPPDAGQWATAMGALPEGDKAPFQQMTFTLHDSQVEIVKQALDAAKAVGDFVDSPNKNSNGNALTRICEAYRGGG